MLPFDNRPWAKTVARTVIALSLLAALAGAYYCYETDQLNIPECAIIFLLLLTILPPNIAIVLRKPHSDDSGQVATAQLRTAK